MAKWADWCISKVRYNSKRTHIDSVEVRRDTGDKIGQPDVWKRQRVVDAIHNSETFVTIVQAKDGNWNRGAEVEIVKIDGEEFIKTVPDKSKKDNQANCQSSEWLQS